MDKCSVGDAAENRSTERKEEAVLVLTFLLLSFLLLQLLLIWLSLLMSSTQDLCFFLHSASPLSSPLPLS